MSLMSLGYKIDTLKKGIEEDRFKTKEQVKQAAEEINVAATIGYENLSSEDKELWYEQLAVNLFENHNNRIPCFIDIGFGRELLDHSSGMWKHSMPEKKHWKIVVTRDRFPQWQFNGIVNTYTREEAVCIMKRFFSDFGGLGFKYEDSAPGTEHKVPWVEINSRKNRINSYKEYTAQSKAGKSLLHGGKNE